MTYNKPLVETVGEATQLVKYIGAKVVGPILETVYGVTFNPTYDLDA